MHQGVSGIRRSDGICHCTVVRTEDRPAASWTSHVGEMVRPFTETGTGMDHLDSNADVMLHWGIGLEGAT